MKDESVTKLAEQISNADSPQAYHAKLELYRRCAKAGAENLANNSLAGDILKEIVATKEVQSKQRNQRHADRAPAYSAAARREMLRCLSEVATGKEVAGLVKGGLSDLEIREMVLYCVSRIPGAEAAKALESAATDGSGVEFRIAAINYLGHRQHGAAALRECATSPDARIRMAAADALANFKEPGHDAIIAAAFTTSGGPTQPHANVNRTRLRLASRLAQAGDGGSARRAFESVLSNSPTAAQKKAAGIGLQKLA